MTARSVLLSVLLGSHPPELPVRTLVSAADLFGVSEGTSRVALSRLVAEGDVVSSGGVYRLSPRLIRRQRYQDSSLWPDTKPWRGAWELAVAQPDVASAADRGGLGTDMERLGLAQLRSGVWARPDNLARPWPSDDAARVVHFSARPDLPSSELAAQLWDLPGWASAAEELIAAMSAHRAPADRFVIAAAMVRHIRTDPVLPPSLLPKRWPGSQLRQAYSQYRHELAELLSGHVGPGKISAREDISATPAPATTPYSSGTPGPA